LMFRIVPYRSHGNEVHVSQRREKQYLDGCCDAGLGGSSTGQTPVVPDK
jgi:hypothetical protein